MEKELEKVKRIFEEERNKLPLVLQNIDFREKKTNVSGKIIRVLKYRTTFYPIDRYYKNVIRLEK